MDDSWVQWVGQRLFVWKKVADRQRIMTQDCTRDCLVLSPVTEVPGTPSRCLECQNCNECDHEREDDALRPLLILDSALQRLCNDKQAG